MTEGANRGLRKLPRLPGSSAVARNPEVDHHSTSKSGMSNVTSPMVMRLYAHLVMSSGSTAGEVAAQDWVLVHDAARPCLSAAQLEHLLVAAGNDPVGGLLAVPVADTLKRADATQRVSATEPRAGLWQAQTPQMFRHAMLLQALQQADAAMITDEASAIEALGHRPLLVAADNSNFKVTYPRDLHLARLILENPHD